LCHKKAFLTPKAVSAEPVIEHPADHIVLATWRCKPNTRAEAPPVMRWGVLLAVRIYII